MADYSGALDYFVDQSRVFIGQNSQSAIVLHGTGGSATQTAQQLGDYFRSTPLMTSVHYGVDRSGVVCQYVRESDGAAGNCCIESGHDTFWDQFGGDNLNLHTISIEHINDASNSLPLTDAQKQASFKLIAYLSKKYNIPFVRIKSHASIAPGSRALCPGPAYPWSDLEAFLKGENAMAGVPAGWHDDGQTLTAPNKVQVVQGFRDWILSHAWDASNIPLLGATALNPVEQGNVALGAGTVQPFRTCVLAWTQSKGVYEMWIGQEWLALYRVWNQATTGLKAAQAQLAQLQAQLVAAQDSTPLVTDLKNRMTQIHTLSDVQEDFLK
jgi:N-acetyl-anhydromuramyl-L-alanine amidase AmpD